jgi:hypothetical protein
MSKRFIASLCLLVGVVALSGCQFVINEGLRGDGDLVTENRDIEEIDAVHLACQGDLIIVLGDREELIVQAESNLMEHIVTKVEDGTLVIRQESGYNLRPTKGLRFALTVRNLEEIRNTGSGDIVAPELDVASFEARLSGSGDLDLDRVLAKDCFFRVTGSGDISVDNITAETLAVDQTGSGEVKIADGRATRFEASLTGSGDCKARDLEVDRAVVRASGSGGVSVHVNDHIEGRLSGSGGLRYGGSPEVDVRTTGSGRARKD